MWEAQALCPIAGNSWIAAAAIPTAAARTGWPLAAYFRITEAKRTREQPSRNTATGHRSFEAPILSIAVAMRTGHIAPTRGIACITTDRIVAYLFYQNIYI